MAKRGAPSARALPVWRHDVPAPDSREQHHQSGGGAEQERDHRGFQTEAAAGQHFRALDVGPDQAVQGKGRLGQGENL